MQKPSEEKRRKILECAGRLFAARPFHEVRLDDVAAAAHVGKGTLYIYFKSKEELYISLIHEGLSRLVGQVKQDVAQENSPAAALDQIVRRLVGFGFGHPEFFDLLRSVAGEQHQRLLEVRRELSDLVARTLRRGAREALWTDAKPELTASFILGMVRSGILYGMANLSQEALSGHILRLLRTGLGMRETT